MPKIPITLITGFLGSGKTSFLREFLSTHNDSGTALIINELGQVALDQRVLKPSVHYADEQMLYLNAGCLCCTKRLDLIESLKALLDGYEARGEALRQVIIETTGLANPAPILWTLLSDAFLCAHFVLQGSIACVDALGGLLQLENDEARQQIVCSDSVLLTKTDLNADTKALHAEILAINPSVAIFDKRGFSYEVLFSSQKALKFTPTEPLQNTHPQGFESLAISFCGAVEWSAFGIWLSMLLHRHGTRILRVKGILDIGEDFLVCINGVGHIIHAPTHIAKCGKKGIVRVESDLNNAKKGFSGVYGSGATKAENGSLNAKNGSANDEKSDLANAENRYLNTENDLADDNESDLAKDSLADDESGSKLVFITRELPKEQILRSLNAFKHLLKADFVVI